MMKNPVDVTLRKVLTQEYAFLRELAEIIWPVCYKNILSVEQIAYMMDMMYSQKVIAEEVSNGVHYDFILSDGNVSGYISWHIIGCNICIKVKTECSHIAACALANKRVDIWRYTHLW